MPKMFRGKNWRIDVADATKWLPFHKKTPRLIFCDPPFNIGMPYPEWEDSMDRVKYADFTLNWVAAIKRMLNIGKPNYAAGCIIAVHVPWQLTKLISGSGLRNQIAEIILHYRFGQCGRGNWIGSHSHCMIFTSGGEHHKWNPDAVLVPSDRATKYGDRRIEDHQRGGERLPCDVWGIPSDGPYWGRVSGTSAERWRKKSGALVDHPNQLPEVYLARLIKAYTDPGDLVIDPFVGSGTTGVVAVALGRSFRGCEIGEQTAASAAKRMKKGAVRV